MIGLIGWIYNNELTPDPAGRDWLVHCKNHETPYDSLYLSFI